MSRIRLSLGPTGVVLGLLLAAAVTEAVLIWLTWLMFLPRFFPSSSLPSDQFSLDFDAMLGPDWISNIVRQSAAFLVLFLAFLASLWLLRRAGQSRLCLLVVFVAPVVWVITVAFMYPPYARDLFHNVADARLLWVYRLNPMVVAPIARPFPIRSSFDTEPSAYGPLWFLLSFPGAIFQPGSYLNSIVLLKLWMGCFYLASGVLVYFIVREKRAGLAVLAVALFLWNPFVVVRYIGDGHNDVVMMFFLLTAIFGVVKKNWALVLPALTLSILIKYATVIAVPLFVVYALRLPGEERRRALRGLFSGAAIAVGLALLAFVPFWAGPRTLHALMGESQLSATSTPHVLEYLVTGSVYPTPFAPTSRLIARVIFFIPYLWLCLRVRPPDRRLQAAIFQALLLFNLIAVAWFRPWYLLWVVTLGALLPWGWFLALTLTISWLGMFPEIVDQYSGQVPWLAASDGRMMLAPILVMFLAPALLWLVALGRTRCWFFSRLAEPLLLSPRHAARSGMSGRSRRSGRS